MKQIWKKLGSALLALCMVLTMLPTVAFAADANTLKSTIEGYSGGTGSLTATVSSDTVTVTGTVTDAASTLMLSIDEGVTVVWTASITAAADYEDVLVNLNSSGTFEMKSGEITATKGTAITGSGNVTITGGTVTSANQHYTIYVNSTASNLTVSGGTIKTTYADNNSGAVAIKTDANTTIFSGDCQVEATGAGFNVAVDAKGDVEVKNSAQILAVKGISITAAGNVAVSGGTVSSSLYSAIKAIGASSAVTVSGGTVSNSAPTKEYSVINMTNANNTAENVTVSGTGQVLAQGEGSTACAIKTSGGVAVNGGTVSATRGTSIYADGSSSTVTISGGTVSNTATVSENPVIYMDNTANTANNITIGASGAVQANGTGDVAVRTYGSVTSSGTMTGKIAYAVTVNNGTADAAFAAQGDTVGITAATQFGQQFLAWQIDRGNITPAAQEANTTFTMPESTVELTATYEDTAIDVSTAGELKAALVINNPRSVNVTANITMAEGISVGANHTLNIPEGYTLSTGATSELYIGTGKTLTLTGNGTLKVNSTVDTGVSVYGTLESKGTGITIETSTGITTTGIALWGAEAQMMVHGGTLNVNNSVGTGISGSVGSTLTVDENCSVNISNTGESTRGINVSGTSAFKDSTVIIDSSHTGIDSLMSSFENSTVTINRAGYAGLSIKTLTMSDSAINVAYVADESDENNYGLAFDGGNTITADQSSKITLIAGAKLSGVSGRFSDCGTVLTRSNITVRAADGTVVATGLTAGDYVWNGTQFTKGTCSVTFNLSGGTRTGGGELTQAILIGESATAPIFTRSGYTFTGWDKDFTNVTGDLTVTATWSYAGGYTVTFNLSGGTRTGGGELTQTVDNGGSAIAPIFTRSGYTFTGWDKPFINVTGDLTVNATWSYNGGGTSGDTGGGGSSTPATPAPTVSGSTATTTVTAKTGSDGTAAATVTQSQVNSAIEKAQKAAKSNGTAPKVEIQVSGASNASATETTLPKAAVQAMVTGKMESMTLSSPVADMTFDAKALAAIAGAASGDVAFTASNVKNRTLSGAAQQLVGDRPVYNLSVTSGGRTISQFGGSVTVSVPYAPAAGEDTNAIVAYFINANGKPELMQNCHYDAKAGALVFTTDHFSQYAVGYNKVAFSDVSDTAWYADAVSYLAARGITGGTSETTFGPDVTLTRGQFITLLLRAYGIDADNSTADNFTDAGNTYYTGYLAAAKRLGISSGVGDNKFAPEQAVTRQDMFTLLYNALKAIDQLPEGDSGKTLSDFTDSGSVSAYAQEAMSYLVKAGIVGGSNGQLSPTATTTRAQMAQVLYNLLKK